MIVQVTTLTVVIKQNKFPPPYFLQHAFVPSFFQEKIKREKKSSFYPHLKEGKKKEKKEKKYIFVAALILAISIVNRNFFKKKTRVIIETSLEIFFV